VKEMDKKSKAKMEMLKQLRKMSGNMMAGEMFNEPVQKVTVAAKDKEGLAEGLEKAKKIVGSVPMDEMAKDYKKDMKEDMEYPEEEMSESSEEEYSENEMPSEKEMNMMSKEELIKFIKENY